MDLQSLGTLLVAAKLLRCAGLRLLWLRSSVWILRRMASRLAALVNHHFEGGGLTSPPVPPQQTGSRHSAVQLREATPPQAVVLRQAGKDMQRAGRA